MNRYQTRKAKALAATLMLAAVETETRYSEAGMLAARMNEEQWRAVAFAAGVPVADARCRQLAVAYLLTVG